MLRPSFLFSSEGNGTPFQYSCLENPVDGGAWWAAVHGVTKSQTQLSDFTLTFHFSLSCVGEGNGNPLQCSCLENPRDRGAWWASIYRVAQSRTQLRPLSSSSSSSRPLFLLCYVLLCFPLFTWQISYCVFHYLSRNQASFDFIII